MKTTLEIDEGIVRELKRRAAEDGTTMSELVESALRMLLRHRSAPGALPPLPTWDGGRLLVDVDNNAALRDLLDEDDRVRR